MSTNGRNLIIVALFLIALVIAVNLAGDSKEPNITSTLNCSGVTTTAVPFQDRSIMLLLNGTFSGQLSVPTSIAEEVKEYFEEANTTLYSFEVEVLKDDGTPQAGITLYVLRVVPPFEPENFEVFIDAKPVSNGTYVPVYPNVPVTIEYHGEKYSGHLTVNPGGKTRARFRVDKSYLDRRSGEIVKLGTLKLRKDGNFTILARVEGSGNYTIIVEGGNGEELAIGGLVVG